MGQPVLFRFQRLGKNIVDAVLVRLEQGADFQRRVLAEMRNELSRLVGVGGSALSTRRGRTGSTTPAAALAPGLL